MKSSAATNRKESTAEEVKNPLLDTQAKVDVHKVGETNLQNVFLKAPAIICMLRGPQHVFILANEMYMQLTGPRDIIGKPVREALPEIEGQGFFEQLDIVYKTGKRFIGKEMPVKLERGKGHPQNVYVNFVYQATHDTQGNINGIYVHGTDVTEQILAREKFRESEKLANFISDSIPQKIWTADPEGNVNYFNQKWLDYTGCTFEELKGWGWKKLIHPSDWEKNQQLWHHSIKTGSNLELEHRVLNKDGDYQWHLSRGIAYKDDEGKIKIWVGTNTEIDRLAGSFSNMTVELGSHKRQLKESEVRRQTILQYAPDAVITIDENGIIMSWNPQSEFIFGWKEKEVLGKTLTETIIPERYRQQHNMGMNHYLKTGEGPVINKPIEIFALNKDKSEFPIELKISSSKINGRHLFIGFVRDISTRRQAEETLKHKTTQLVEAQRLAHIGSWEWDVPAKKFEWSDELYRIYGSAPKEFEPNYENFLKFIHPDDREYVNDTVQLSLKDQQPFSLFHKAIRTDGIVRVLSVTGKVFTDNKGNTIKMSGTAQDVTEQKNYEAELKQKNQQLEIINKELQSFAYVSSHDLQEPLRKIQIFAGRIVEKEYDNLSENGQRQFNRMFEAAKRMQTLIQDLLDYSRTSRDKQEFVKTDLTIILEEVKEEIKEELQQKQATIEATEMCEANIIPFQFRQLMHNIIGNALKFSKPDTPPHIKIKSEVVKGKMFNNEKLQPQNDYCHINFTDNGIGFENKYGDRIFEVFQRLHDREIYSGTGIGLAIVKKIVENHNGIITASGKLGKGAAFDIYIPAT